MGTYFNDMARIFSPNPGSILLHTASVASGVLSLGAGPVPPVVTTKLQPSLSTCTVQCVDAQGFLHCSINDVAEIQI